MLPSRPWLEVHKETASPHRLGGGELPWQPRKPLLLPSPGFIEEARGLVGSLSSQGYRIENERGTGVADGTFVRELGYGEMTNCGITTLEGQGPSM